MIETQLIPRNQSPRIEAVMKRLFEIDGAVKKYFWIERINKFIGMTGAPWKQENWARNVGEIVGQEKVTVFDPGYIVEPKTPDSEHLIDIKHSRQVEAFRKELERDPALSKEYSGCLVVLGAMDSNQILEGLPMTKQNWQRDTSNKDIWLYINHMNELFIEAVARSKNMKIGEFLGETLTKGIESHPLTVDFHDIEKLGLYRVVRNSYNSVKLEQLAPGVIIHNRAYVSFDFKMNRCENRPWDYLLSHDASGTLAQHYFEDIETKNGKPLSDVPYGIEWEKFLKYGKKRGYFDLSVHVPATIGSGKSELDDLCALSNGFQPATIMKGIDVLYENRNNSNLGTSVNIIVSPS